MIGIEKKIMSESEDSTYEPQRSPEWTLGRMHMQYSSDSSSDGETQTRTLDWSRLTMDHSTLVRKLDEITEKEKKRAKDIEVLQLEHNRLRKLPESFAVFASLKALDISSNTISYIPDIFKYCQLSTFIAKNNNFTNESLPKSFTFNPVLREINFGGNKFTHFPEQILDCPNIKYLYLAGNKIVNISKNIYKLQSLQILSMGGNNLQEVPSSVGQLHQLKALILFDNLLESLPSNIANCVSLKSLQLHKNRLRTLPPEIVALKNLTELSLRDNPLIVQFVSDMTYNPASLLELSARTVKISNITVNDGDVPKTLMDYLSCAHHCVNPKCKGVYFDNRVEHVKFVDFCGKYRIPLLQYLCSSKCITSNADLNVNVQPNRSYLMQKVLLG